MKEHAAPPVFSRLALIRASVCPDLGRLRYVETPKQSAAFINRVQGVENDEGARQWHPGLDNPLAEAGHQLALAAADQPGLRYPTGELVECDLVHIHIFPHLDAVRPSRDRLVGGGEPAGTAPYDPPL